MYFIIGVQLLKSGIYLTLGAIRGGRFIEMRGGGGIQKDRIKYLIIIIRIAFRIWYAPKVTCAKVQKSFNLK